MEQVLIWLLFAVGLVLIVKGGDYFVDAASWIAEVSGVPKFVIGATIVSIATTLPEVIVSLVAALQHETEMAVGNAVGSVTANIGLITGILFVCMPFAVERKQFFVKSLLMIASCAALLLFSFGGELGAAGTAVLFIIFAVFVTENIISARRESQKEGAKKASSKAKAGETAQNIVKFILGAAGIVIGARLLVDNGTKIAQMFGVDERVIGLTMVAVGTSLPELVTTVSAVLARLGRRAPHCAADGAAGSADLPGHYSACHASRYDYGQGQTLSGCVDAGCICRLYSYIGTVLDQTALG